MIGTTDWAGIAAVISAVFAGIAAIIGALTTSRTNNIKKAVDTNGDPRTLGQIATDVAKNIAPAPPAANVEKTP